MDVTKLCHAKYYAIDDFVNNKKWYIKKASH